LVRSLFVRIITGSARRNESFDIHQASALRKPPNGPPGERLLPGQPLPAKTLSSTDRYRPKPILLRRAFISSFPLTADRK
jgi:hypothetical protein